MSPEEVVDATSLAHVLHDQVEQLRMNLDRWENVTLADFLLAGAAWLEDR